MQINTKNRHVLKVMLYHEPQFQKSSYPKISSACNRVQHYSQLIAGLCSIARTQKRVTSKEKQVENEKFAFRVFLIRLGFIGNEYKTTRKILLKNLSGNSAFRDGTPRTEVSVDE